MRTEIGNKGRLLKYLSLYKILNSTHFVQLGSFPVSSMHKSMKFASLSDYHMHNYRFYTLFSPRRYLRLAPIFLVIHTGKSKSVAIGIGSVNLILSHLIFSMHKLFAVPFFECRLFLPIFIENRSIFITRFQWKIFDFNLLSIQTKKSFTK